MQGHRFDIIEDIGCQAATYYSIPAVFIIWFPPLLFATITFIYGGELYCTIYLPLYTISRRSRTCPPPLLQATPQLHDPHPQLRLRANHAALSAAHCHVPHGNDLGHEPHRLRDVRQHRARPLPVRQLGVRARRLLAHRPVRHSRVH